MPDDKVTISEIMGLFSNTDNIRSDIGEAYDIMREHLQKKYINKMMRTIDSYHNQARKNPPDEIKLLKAWKPFAPKDAHERIDGFIDMLHTANMLKEMMGSAGNRLVSNANHNSGVSAAARMDERSVSAAQTNQSVHSDGVYDIDEQCYISYLGRHAPGFENMAGIMMAFALMNK